MRWEQTIRNEPSKCFQNITYKLTKLYNYGRYNFSRANVSITLVTDLVYIKFACKRNYLLMLVEFVWTSLYQQEMKLLSWWLQCNCRFLTDFFLRSWLWLYWCRWYCFPYPTVQCLLSSFKVIWSSPRCVHIYWNIHCWTQLHSAGQSNYRSKWPDWANWITCDNYGGWRWDWTIKMKDWYSVIQSYLWIIRN